MGADRPIQRDVEYQALRAELLRRIENRYQIIQVTIIGAGSILAIGLKSDDFIPILLLFPIFVFFLAASWAHNGVAHMKLSWYIMTEIEHYEPNKVSYETWSRREASSSLGGKLRDDVLGNAAAAGVFVVTQLMALTFGVLAWTKATPSVVSYADKPGLVGLDVVVVALTVGVMAFTARATWTLRDQAMRPGLAAGPRQSDARPDDTSGVLVDASATEAAADKRRLE
jgi:hypothetical protein